jgi:HEAT repeat protein
MTPNPPPNPPPVENGIRAVFLVVILAVVAGTVAVLVSVRGYKQSIQPARFGGVAQKIFSTAAPPKNPLPPVLEAADPTTAKLIAQFYDESLPLKVRRQAARALAKLGSAAAMAALKSALAEKNSPSYLKAAIAEGLGESPNPEARGLLNSLINDQDEITARGAVRGLALSNDTDAVNSLSGLLFNEQVPLSVRTEAALALGDMNLPGALDALTRAATEITDENVIENVLDGLGKRPFSETEQFFSSYLASEDVSAESKVAAIEALGSAPGDVVPFLLKYLNDPDADMRAAAAWALNTAGDTSDIGPQLTAALKQETDPNVRARIYQALENQSGEDLQAILPLVQNESDPAAQLAGLTYLAGTLRSSPSPEVADFFNQTAVPELKGTALSSDSAQNRLAAVIALGQAGTPAASGALQEIARQSTDNTVVAAAQRMLSKPSR